MLMHAQLIHSLRQKTLKTAIFDTAGISPQYEVNPPAGRIVATKGNYPLPVKVEKSFFQQFCIGV